MVTIRSWLLAARLAFLRDRVQRSGLLEQPWRSRTAVVLWLAAFLLTCNLYLLATDLSAAVRNLGTSVSAVETALILFPLLAGLGVPAGHELVEAYGRERAARWALAIFGAGLLITAASPWIGLVVVAYAITGGAAGAVVLAATWSLVEAARTPESRAAGLAVLGLAPLAGTVAGPLIGGFVAEESTWRLGLLFELVIVVVLVALLPADEKPPQRAPLASWPSLLITPLGAAAVLVGVGLADDYGWWRATRPLSIGPIEVTPFGMSVAPLLIAVGALTVLVGLTRATNVRLRDYASPRFLGALTVSLALGASTTGAIYALLQYFAIGARLDELATGLSLAPFGLGATLAAGAMLLLAKKVPASWPVVAAGVLVSAAGVLAIAFGIRAWGGGWGTAPGVFILGVGNGLALGRAGSITVSTLGTRRQAEASAINSGVGDVAYALGIAVLGAVFVGAAAHAIIGEVDRQLVAGGGAGLSPAVRQQAEARLENDLRTLTPAEQDAYVEAQPPALRHAIESASAGAFKDGITAALLASLGGLGVALATLLGTEAFGVSRRRA